MPLHTDEYDVSANFLIKSKLLDVNIHGKRTFCFWVSVKSDKSETKFIKLVTNIDEQILYLLVNIAANACLFTVFVEGRFNDFRLIVSSKLIVSYKLTNNGVSVDINGKTFGILFFGLVNLHINNIFSRSYFQETIQALMVSLNILSIVELIPAKFILFSLLTLLDHEILDR